MKDKVDLGDGVAGSGARRDSSAHLTERDREFIAQLDGDFQPHSWEDIRRVVETNDLSVLKREPSDLKEYRTWAAGIKERYGSITSFICKERLHWEPLPSTTPDSPTFAYNNPIPFADPADYKILRNDWPYGLEPAITHLVVWSKVPIPTEPVHGDLTDDSRALVKSFIDKTFEQRVAGGGDAAEKVLWFKNWTSLQSVRGLEHVHVMVRGVARDIIDEWTGPPT
ncbi:MAG: hypothetical protein M1832_006037 [Thelocarpon impressellum]|nr:MAG: hypothetical protein M1832_006037 [Thelocarpon impressellum]